MEIGIDDLDDFGYEEIEESTEQFEENNQEIIDTSKDDTKEDDFISSLLKTRGIENSSKIKFENEEGSVEEVDWNDLSNEDKLNILNSSENSETDLDDSEIQLINSIRQSGMSPSEYLQYIQQTSVSNYIQNNQQDSYSYSIDQYNDDDLYVYDLMSRTGMTVEEAQESLERAKSNEALFTKQIGAIRNEYKEAEKEQLQNAQNEENYLAQEQYNQFAQSIADEIVNFKEFSGYSIEMNDEDMQEIYEFLTGFDAAGNNYFGKALNDPKLVVQMAYFALNGQRLINDITEYFQKEITKVGRESYAKGLAAQNKDKNNMVYIDKNRKDRLENYNDLDDF